MKNLLKKIESLESYVRFNGVDKESFYTLLAIVKNACHCEEYHDEFEDDEDNICPYCYVKDILNKTK